MDSDDYLKGFAYRVGGSGGVSGGLLLGQLVRVVAELAVLALAPAPEEELADAVRHGRVRVNPGLSDRIREVDSGEEATQSANLRIF